MNYSTFLSIILHGVALCLFINGFFPTRVSIPSTQHSQSSTQCLNNSTNAISRLIIMVIDGWRSEFLFSRPKEMPFLSTHGKAFECKVQHPTVTMPRLKAALSGIVPSYLDVALNLASTEFSEENWLKTAKKSGKKAVFYGDDTWLKFFPNGIFESRSEGTVSFFVTDYTEVDDNVTRHLNDEFSEEYLKQWDILILHYLGLDHIGHSLGDKTNLINVKLNEMDSIAKDIYQKLNSSTENFAIIVFGDHGMADNGGHGGATYMETHVPVTFLFPNEPTGRSAQQESNYFKIEQVDLVPTISSLLNLEIPANSLGVSFVDQLNLGNNNDFSLWSLLQNGNQLRHLLVNAGNKVGDEIIEEFDICLVELSSACDQNANNESKTKLISKCYSTFKKLQEIFINLASEYKYEFLVFGLLFSLLATSISFSILSIDTFSFEKAIVFAQPFCNFASSFVEEEQHIWNFLLSSMIALRIYQSWKLNKKWTKEDCSLLGILVVHRICETLKQSITVFLPADDQTVKLLSNLPSIIVLFSLHSSPIWTKAILSMTLFSDPFQIPSDWITISGILLLTFYACLFVQILFSPISDALLFWILSLASPSNKIILFLCMAMGHFLIQTKCKNSESIFYLAIASSFYYTGNSHSLATLDLSSAYTRLPFYNPAFVGIQLFLVSYSAPIMLMIIRWKQTSFTNFPDHLLFYRSSSLLLCLSALFLHRHHLFVWSVFAPKLVYEIFHFCATVIFCFGLKISSFKLCRWVK